MAEARRVFISVAEDSADMHAAALVRCAQSLLPQCTFYGLTGPRLRGLGVETIYDMATHAAMLAGVLGVWQRAREAVRAIERSWQENRPDAVVLLDSPELHLGLATRAKRLGLPVLYYIAPQTWASRAYRNGRIARDIDRLACILPFEEKYFRDAGARAEFVGHPLFETLREQQPLPETVEFLKSRAAGRPIVALLPGSRRGVIDAILPRQLEVIRHLRSAGRDVYAAISCVSTERRQQIRDILARHAAPAEALSTAATSATTQPDAADPVDADIDIVVADNASLLPAADLVLVASGTATLEVAYHGKPMIVMYDAGRLLAWPYRALGRYVIRSPHLALVNVLAGARIVPEFMPFVPDTRPVAQVAAQLLNDQDWRARMTGQLEAITAPLRDSTASRRVCQMISELAGVQTASS